MVIRDIFYPSVPGQPLNLSVENISSAYLISWEPPTHPNGVILDYEVFYRVSLISLDAANTKVRIMNFILMLKDVYKSFSCCFTRYFFIFLQVDVFQLKCECERLCIPFKLFFFSRKKLLIVIASIKQLLLHR